MSSAFFRRPSSLSSNTSSDEESADGELSTKDTNNSAIGESLVTNTESLPSHESVSLGDEVDIPTNSLLNVDRHRTNLLSALLEDFAKSRASELLNTANPGANFDKSSPEIEPLAESLYQQVSQSLSVTGILPDESDAKDNKQARAAYLAGLESLALSNISQQSLPRQIARPQLLDAEQQLAVVKVNNQPQGVLPYTIERSTPDFPLQHNRHHSTSLYSSLKITSGESRRTHYESSFKQIKLLGKGGFGRVYHAYNVFDNKEYAVKKIPLSPRLSQRYRESGHKELEGILREVQALAQLEHNNIVRYHATWIEEPKATSIPTPYQSSKQSLTVQGRKLIAAQTNHDRPTSLRPQSPIADHTHGAVFGTSSRETTSVQQYDRFQPGPMWSVNDTNPEPSSARPSAIFTDGNNQLNNSEDDVFDDSVYVLHVQMSVYPTTLAQYLAPLSTNSSKSLASMPKRHCFHLVPALRILLGILCGLQYIHAQGLIHRDLKPSNIFISTLDVSATNLIPDGYHDIGSCSGCQLPKPYFANPRIGDFGLVADLVQSSGSSLSENSRSSRVVGTEYYRPPLQSEMHEKVDIFALGVIFIELLWPCATSTERMHVLQAAQKGKAPPQLGDKIEREGHGPSVSALLIQCITGMIQPQADLRWDSARVKDTIETLLIKATESPATGEPPELAFEEMHLNDMSKVKSIDETTKGTSTQHSQAESIDD